MFTRTQHQKFCFHGTASCTSQSAVNSSKSVRANAGSLLVKPDPLLSQIHHAGAVRLHWPSQKHSKEEEGMYAGTYICVPMYTSEELIAALAIGSGTPRMHRHVAASFHVVQWTYLIDATGVLFAEVHSNNMWYFIRSFIISTDRLC